MNALSIDFESASAVDIQKAGAHAYWEHHSTEPLCAHFAIGDEEPTAWVPGDPLPLALVAHIRNGGIVSGWNVGFERLCFEHAMVPHYGWPMPKPEQFEDTMALAAAMGLPLSLEKAAPAIGIAERKDAAGKKLMKELAKTTGPIDPEKFKRLLEYNKTDVLVERSMRNTLLALSKREIALWQLDAKVNARGVMLDMKLVDKLHQIIDDEQARLNADISTATGGAIHSTNQHVAIRKWVCDHGVETDSVDAPTVIDLLEQPMPDDVRRVLEIRQEAAKGTFSKGKLDAAQLCACSDDRARGLLQYMGASSGRWAGRLMSPHNFPRPTGWVKDADAALPWLMSGSASAVDFAYGWPLRVVGDCLRSIIIAAPGHDLIAADFSSIESRLLGWIAGASWKLDAYRAEDAKQGPGMYELNAASIFAKPVETILKESFERQVGKTAELSMGYAGGVTALMKGARKYSVKMAVALPGLMASAPKARIEAAERRYLDCLKRSDSSADILSKDAWMACELTKHAWRAANPEAVDFWADLAQAALSAVDHPDKVFPVRGGIAFRMARGALWQRLPSGRVICYPDPKISLREVPWSDKTVPVEQRERRRTVVTRTSERGKWVPQPLYGGLLCAYTVQGSARDLLADAMLRIEAAGYPIVLSVHDEAVAEIPEQFGSLDEFCELMVANEAWANGLPTVAKGYRAKRFKKG